MFQANVVLLGNFLKSATGMDSKVTFSSFVAIDFYIEKFNIFPPPKAGALSGNAFGWDRRGALKGALPGVQRRPSGGAARPRSGGRGLRHGLRLDV